MRSIERQIHLMLECVEAQGDGSAGERTFPVQLPFGRPALNAKQEEVVCPHCGQASNLFGQGGGEKAAADFQIPLLGKIPLEPKLVAHGDDGTPFIQHQKESHTAKIMEDIVDKIVQFI